jgi:PelA/Pel-15E family pectate lyase
MSRGIWLVSLVSAVMGVAGLTACSSVAPTAISAAPARSPQVLRTVALILGEPNFSVDGAYQELEEGLYTQPELRNGSLVMAPLGDIVPYLGGQYSFSASDGRIQLSLGDKTLLTSVGQRNAIVNGAPVVLEAAVEERSGSAWMPVSSVWEAMGAFVKWDKTRQRLTGAFVLPAGAKLADFARGGPVTEETLLSQNAAFYGSADGVRMADVIVGYQNADGGWPKLEKTVSLLTPVNKEALTGFRSKSTIDNDSTTKQLVALAKVHAVSGKSSHKESFMRGLDYLLNAQHRSGGWQQFWPQPQGYKARITFNDDAIANVLEILRDVVDKAPEMAFVDAARVAKARDAYTRGLKLILASQIRIDGKKTGWAAQYDEVTLKPAMGRAFELASISGDESINVLRFLMSVPQPSSEVVDAIQSGVAWFEAAKVSGIRLIQVNDKTLEFGFDRRVLADPSAPPLWARFYDLEIGRPLFTSWDGVKKTSYADVSYERRVKYNWYTSAAAELLSKDHPAWQARNKMVAR